MNIFGYAEVKNSIRAINYSFVPVFKWPVPFVDDVRG
jgi:hypothetical protein